MTALNDGDPNENTGASDEVPADWPQGAPHFRRHENGTIVMTWPNERARNVYMASEMLEAIVADHNRFITLITAYDRIVSSFDGSAGSPVSLNETLRDVVEMRRELGLRS